MFLGEENLISHPEDASLTQRLEDQQQQIRALLCFACCKRLGGTDCSHQDHELSSDAGGHTMYAPHVWTGQWEGQLEGSQHDV